MPILKTNCPNTCSAKVLISLFLSIKQELILSTKDLRLEILL